MFTEDYSLLSQQTGKSLVGALYLEVLSILGLGLDLPSSPSDRHVGRGNGSTGRSIMVSACSYRSFKAECEKKWVKCVEELLEKDITEDQLIKSVSSPLSQIHVQGGLALLSTITWCNPIGGCSLCESVC